jgi:hypothetical protein
MCQFSRKSYFAAKKPCASLGEKAISKFKEKLLHRHQRRSVSVEASTAAPRVIIKRQQAAVSEIPILKSQHTQQNEQTASLGD